MALCKLHVAPKKELSNYNPCIIQGLGLDPSLTDESFWRVVHRFQDFDKLSKDRNITISFRGHRPVSFKFTKDTQHLLLIFYYYLLFSEGQPVLIVCPLPNGNKFICECVSYKYKYDSKIETFVHIKEDGQPGHIVIGMHLKTTYY